MEKKNAMLKKIIDGYKIFHEMNTVSFKEWMTATLSVRATGKLLQRMDSCN